MARDRGDRGVKVGFLLFFFGAARAGPWGTVGSKLAFCFFSGRLAVDGVIGLRPALVAIARAATWATAGGHASAPPARAGVRRPGPWGQSWLLLFLGAARGGWGIGLRPPWSLLRRAATWATAGGHASAPPARAEFAGRDPFLTGDLPSSLEVWRLGFFWLFLLTPQLSSTASVSGRCRLALPPA